MNRKIRRALSSVGAASKPRSEQDVRNTYLNKCAQAGELQYKLGEMSQALVTLNKEIRDLNIEYTAILAEAAKGKKNDQVTEVPAKS